MENKIDSGMIDKIPAEKFNSITIVEDGVKKKLSPVEVKARFKKFVFGGKTPDQIDRKMFEDGIKGTGWETRKKFMKMFNDLLEGNLSDRERAELQAEIDTPDEDN